MQFTREVSDVYFSPATSWTPPPLLRVAKYEFLRTISQANEISGSSIQDFHPFVTELEIGEFPSSSRCDRGRSSLFYSLRRPAPVPGGGSARQGGPTSARRRVRVLAHLRPLVAVSKTKAPTGRNAGCLSPLRRGWSRHLQNGQWLLLHQAECARVCEPGSEGVQGVRCVCARLREGLAAVAGAGTDSPGGARAAPHTKPLASPLTPHPSHSPLLPPPPSPAPSKLSDWPVGQKFLWRRLGADVTGRIVPFRDPGGSAHVAGCRLEAGGGSSGPGGSQVAERSTQHPGGGTTPAGFPWRFLWV